MVATVNLKDNTLTITATDFANQTVEYTIKINVIANQLPTFSETSKTVSVAENNDVTNSIVTVTATDPENDQITYILEGPDAHLFDINPNTGEITVKQSFDFEMPLSADGTNNYKMKVRATTPLP